MALRYMPKEAEPIRAKIVNLENELVSKFSNLFTVISWLDNDRWDLFYRPAYFGTFNKEDRRNCRYVHDKASFGKTGRSFGLTYDLYLIQMNNLNFGNALAGPGLRYKDGELAKIYINRIIDSSNDMDKELMKINRATRDIRVHFGTLPSTHDSEWERRYKKIGDLITNIEEAINECDDAIDEREALGDQLLMTWFPELETEQNQVLPNPLVVDGTEGTVDNPYILAESPNTPIFDTDLDITSLVDFSDRDAQTYFNFQLNDSDRSKTWKFKFETTPAQDWDTHVEMYAGDRFQGSAQEMVAPTPHTLQVVPQDDTTDILLRLEHWERIPNKTAKAVLTIEKEAWQDDGGL